MRGERGEEERQGDRQSERAGIKKVEERGEKGR